MYSYEARIRAAELYIKLGKRVRPTIRQLGYPTKSSLKGWYNEYQRKLDLPMGYAGREPKFSQAQKAAAVEHYLTHDQCIAVTMRALGYPGRGTLTKWVREAFPEVRRAAQRTERDAVHERSWLQRPCKLGRSKPCLLISTQK